MKRRILDLVLIGVVLLNAYAGYLWGWDLAHSMWRGALP